MKNLLILIFLFQTFTGYTQELGIRINLDSVEFIRIIDHQNFNYEWYSGRVYEITKNDLAYEMQLVEQYSKPFFFGEPVTSVKEDSLDISKSKLLEKLEISINQDSAIILANSVVSKKHQYWANRINIEKIDGSIKIESFNEQQLFELTNAINDRDSRSPRKILESLDMDSLWITENSLRLFEA